LNEINNNLQRVRELSVQAANESNSDTDLDSIQDEIKQRLDEIDRVSRETDFNGVKVLGETATTLKIQVGANDGQTISIGLRKVNADSLGLTGFNVNGKGETPNAAATKDSLKLAGFDNLSGTAEANGSYKYSKTETITTTNVAATSADVFGKLANGSTVAFATTLGGLQASGSTTFTYAAGTDSFTATSAAPATAANVGNSTFLKAAVGETQAATVTIGGKSTEVKIDSDGNIAAKDGTALYIDSVGNLTATGAGTVNLATTQTLADSMANASTGTGGTIVTADGVTFTATAGSDDISVAVNFSKADLKAQADASTSGYTANGYTVAATTGKVTQGGADVYVSSETGTVGDLVTAETYDTDTTTEYYVQTSGAVTDNTGLRIYENDDGFTTEATTAGAATPNALKAIDDALKDVDKLRGELGAVQNRFESTIANLNNTLTNLSSARSRIEDADYAVEVSNMTRAQILQQAGTSVLAQANQVPQGVLSLLR